MNEIVNKQIQFTPSPKFSTIHFGRSFTDSYYLYQKLRSHYTCLSLGDTITGNENLKMINLKIGMTSYKEINSK